MTPVVTLIIATFNHAPYLPAALECALAQTLRDVEVIVVDDGSTDETPDVLARYGAGIRSARQPNRGLAAARNVGLTMAQGAYIAFLDADDLLDPTKLARQVAILEENPRIGWTYCDVRIQDQDTGAAITASERFGYHRRPLDGWLFPALIQGNFIPAMAPLIRHWAIEAVGGFDPALTALEDWDLWLRLALEAEARYNPAVLATYRIRRDGMSQDRARMDHNRFRILEKASRSHPHAIRSLGTMGRRIVADMHNWFGCAAYTRGDWPEATRRFAASLRSFPCQRRSSLLLARCLWRRWLR